MKTHPLKLAIACFAFLAIDAPAAMHYVSLSSTNPVVPYTNWLTAATNIQDAVSVAQPGEVVAADAGLYNQGGVVIYGSETNRVALTNGITLLGVYGPQSTLIVGGTKTRCVYVGSNSVISGFTITNGQTSLVGDFIREESGGGIWCEPGGAVADCLVISNFAGYMNNLQSSRIAGGIYGGTVSNCTLTGNVAGCGGGAGGSGVLWNCTLTNNFAGSSGGGVYQVALYNCILSNNSTEDGGGLGGSGGGAYQCLAYHCILANNAAVGYGGGAFQGTNFNCLITGNTAYGTGGDGGGTYQSTNYNCIISGNGAFIFGGGVYGGVLYNCVLTGNVTSNTFPFFGYGGGAYSATLYNCTVSGNTASTTGGGIYGGTAFNSIIYFNNASADSNWANSPQMYYCCTTPFYNSGIGIITNDPSFVGFAGGNLRLQTNSPCINAGNNTYAVGSTDLDGRPRIVGGTVDIGAYEFQGAGMGEFIGWLQQCGLPTDGSADYADSDGDGFNNYNEWRAGTSPTDPSSLLKMTTVTNDVSGNTVTWQSVGGINYFLQRGTNFVVQPVFTSIQSNIIGQAVTTSYTDTSATNGRMYFYRVGVQ